jgi:chromosomal replication initiator protein
MTKAPITTDMARQTIRHLSVSLDRKVSIDSVLRAVADKYDLQPAQIKQRSNQKHIAFPRQVTMYIARELTTASLPEIGRALGGKHHTTVLHSIQKIERERNHDQDLNKTIQSIVDSFQ